MHVCPMVTVLVPHVGGPILPPGAPTVLIGGMPAATVTGMCTCVGPPDIIIMGSTGVLINYLPAARLGDPTAHGGVITLGCPTVMIGEVGSPSPGAAGAAAVSSGLAATGHDNPINANKSVYANDAGGAGAAAGAVSAAEQAAKKDATIQSWRDAHSAAIKQALADQRKLLEQRKADLENPSDSTKADMKKWFGSDDEATRKTLLDRTNKELALNEKMTPDNFFPADPPEPGTFAYVHPNDPDHKIFLDSGFDNAPATGDDSKAGTLAHEMSHFNDVGGTADNAYGRPGAIALAKSSPADALKNADSYEYFVESAGSKPAP